MPTASARKPNQSNRRCSCGLGLFHEQQHADDGDDADRQVDQEHPVPGVIVGQPGAERRAHDRPQHHADAPDRHGAAALLGRIGVEQHRLRQRHQRGAGHALQQAEQHDLLDVLRQRAQQRGDGEAGDADDEQLLAAEAVGQPADRRRHDGGGDDIGGQHPVDLVERGRQRALHVGQRDIGDGGVERLHDGRRHRAHRHQHAQASATAMMRGRSFLGVGISLAKTERNGQQPAVAGVDVDVHAHAGAQQVRVLALVEGDAHRHALHHLDPVAAWRSAAAGSRTARRCRG